MPTTRFYWLDSMKVLGLLLIISGHYTPPHYEYLYVFSVQMFFIMSGFLSKNVASEVFIKKTMRQLVVPMLLLGFIALVLTTGINLVSGEFSISKFLNSALGIIYGDQRSLGGLWFVYTLIIAKVISQIPSVKVKFVVALVCLAGAWCYSNYSEPLYQNCWLNTLLAYPMFFIGELAARRKEKIAAFDNKLWLSALLILGAVGVYVCGSMNDTVWMYRCLYGSNMIVFLSGSLCGTVMVYAMTKLFLDFPMRYMTLLADGSILILAFHIRFVLVGLHFPVGYWFYLEAILVLLLFIPIIILCKRYAPVLLGYRGIRNPQTLTA